MQENDPLALRHGRLVADAWSCLNRARRESSPNRAMRHLPNLEMFARRLAAARSLELYCGDFDAVQVNNWFDYVEAPLTSACQALRQVPPVKVA